MPTTRNAILPRPAEVSDLVIDVVDGNGLEVAGERVSVNYITEGGRGGAIEGVTDSRGRALFSRMPQTAVVHISAAGEAAGPIVVGAGGRVVVET
ncbi:MAG TPA: hypothetical protein VLB67_08420 [Acidimicrobiia bacterium]|nr:hypothetical protein [Acidimicrobiia bacterium]